MMRTEPSLLSSELGADKRTKTMQDNTLIEANEDRSERDGAVVGRVGTIGSRVLEERHNVGIPP